MGGFSESVNLCASVSLVSFYVFLCMPPPLKLLYCFSSFFQLLVLSHSNTSQVDDLYIEEPGSGDVPIDDEDGEDDGSGSGSGSGDHGKSGFAFVSLFWWF